MVSERERKEGMEISLEKDGRESSENLPFNISGLFLLRHLHEKNVLTDLWRKLLSSVLES